MFVSIVTAFAYKADKIAEEQVSAAFDDIEHDQEYDAMSLLQTQVEVAQGTAKTDFVELDGNDEYDLAEPLNCASEKSSHVELASPVELVAEPAVAAPQETEQAEADPPGADMLRTVLQAMTVLLVVDGLWKCYLQRQMVEPKNSKCIQSKRDEAAAQSAWVKMVQAANSGDERSFMESLSLHPTVMQTDAWGCTPLHFAAAGGSAMITTELLKLGAEVDALDAMDETPLHIAARTGAVSVSEALVKTGANINAVNKEGMTPIVIAGHANQESTCRFLADSGAGCAGLKDEDLPPLVVSQFVRRMLAPVSV